MRCIVQMNDETIWIQDVNNLIFVWYTDSLKMEIHEDICYTQWHKTRICHTEWYCQKCKNSLKKIKRQNAGCEQYNHNIRKIYTSIKMIVSA